MPDLRPGPAGTVIYHSISCACPTCIRLDECLQGVSEVRFGDLPRFFYDLTGHRVVMKPDLSVPDGWARQYIALGRGREDVRA